MDSSLWKEALLCRESNNVLAVANSFLYALRALHEEQSHTGRPAEWISHHPIVRLFTARLAELSGAPTVSDMEEVRRRAHG